MADAPTRKEKRAEEKKRFKDLGFLQKLTYIRDYYLLKIVLVLALLAGIGIFIYDNVRAAKTIYVGSTVGFDVSDEGYTYLTDGFIDSLGRKYRKKKAELTRDVLSHPYEDAQYHDMSMELTYTTQINAGMFQYALMDKDNLEHFSGYDFYLDLSYLKDDPKFSGLEYYTNESGIPCAILLPESVMEKIGVSDKEIYLAFIYSKKPNELNEKMVSYLFGIDE